jgi:YbbR domain-containing protein
VSTLDSDDLKFALDLTGARSGSLSYPLGPNSFNVPRGVTVSRITPPIVHLRLEPVAKRTLPVTVRYSGKPPPGYKIAQAAIEPETVSVQGPADEVGRLTAVETVPVDLEDKPGVIKRKARLSASGKPFSFSPDYVAVSVTLEIDAIEREFAHVNVQARDFRGASSVSPRSVYLKLAGPRNVMGKLQLGVNQVFLDLKGLGTGEHIVGLNFNLPPGVKVVEQKPERFKVKITKLGA